MECPAGTTYCKSINCLQCVEIIKEKYVFSYTDTGLSINRKQFVVSLGYYFFRINEVNKIPDIINVIEVD